jgi:Fe-S oxidoreductase
MLTPVEKILFAMLAFFSIGLAYQGFNRMIQIIGRGQGDLKLNNLPMRVLRAGFIYISQQTTLKTRSLTSLFHLGVVWGFTFYFLVNVGDLLEAYIGDYVFLGTGNLISDGYHLIADVLSIAVLVGVVYFFLRRFYLPQQEELQFHDNVLLHEKVKKGRIDRDSTLVVVFIFVHVGARFLGESLKIELGVREGDFMPFASIVSLLWAPLDEGVLEVLEHLMFWLALGGILVFLPYFPYTKHAHLFMAPINYLTQPDRTSMGEMTYLDFEDEEIEQFGVNNLYHLHKTQVMDAFACIMCNRCQDVCPAYVTGKELSPSALEINKRYFIKDRMQTLAEGEELEEPLMGSVISESAVWACTSCGACIEVCPVGNEPMLDILDIRRDAVLMQAEFPAELQAAMNGMERQSNPWQVSESRMAWAEGLDIPTVEDNPDFEYLYWVGCAAAFDPRASQVARSFVKILQHAGVNFAVLGEEESCTGDTARRAGNEYLYFEMASANVETLNGHKVKKIVVTCPHCLHNLGNEYHQFGGNYEVIHHTQLIDQLVKAGKVPASASLNGKPNVTFHDPCYLGRHSGVYDEPREVIEALKPNVTFTELPRNRNNSFCCGAGGAQFWKEEEHGDEAVNVNRYKEAQTTGADTLAVGCPFCMQMFDTARSEIPEGPEVKDVAELIAANLEKKPAETAAD